MKKIALGLFIIGNSILNSSCNGKKTEETTVPTEIQEQYQCPMKCTEEISTKPGKCSVCEMDLEKVNNG